VTAAVTFITVAIWFWYPRWGSAENKREEQRLEKMAEPIQIKIEERGLENLAFRKVSRTLEETS
jgi:hypothetical protein